MQKLANQYNVNIVRVYGIAEHGKGEVDHVGGLAKTAVRKEVSNGEFFARFQTIEGSAKFKVIVHGGGG